MKCHIKMYIKNPFVIGVTTLVVDQEWDNCGWCCDSCGFLQQLWVVATIVNIATIVIINQGITFLKTDIFIHFILNCLIWSYYELDFCMWLHETLRYLDQIEMTNIDQLCDANSAMSCFFTDLPLCSILKGLLWKCEDFLGKKLCSRYSAYCLKIIHWENHSVISTPNQTTEVSIEAGLVKI